jgi:hypothetical protein
MSDFEELKFDDQLSDDLEGSPQPSQPMNDRKNKRRIRQRIDFLKEQRELKHRIANEYDDW